MDLATQQSIGLSQSILE